MCVTWHQKRLGNRFQSFLTVSPVLSLVSSTEQIAEDCCLTIVGSLVTSGSKLGLALDQNADSQFWNMKSDGRIYSKMKPNLVLDIKGKSPLVYISYFLG